MKQLVIIAILAIGFLCFVNLSFDAAKENSEAYQLKQEIKATRLDLEAAQASQRLAHDLLEIQRTERGE